MNYYTKATINEIESVEWFGAVGRRDVQGAVVLDSWVEAISSCSSVGWQHILLEATNQYREMLLLHSKEHFNRWNQVVDEMKVIAEPLVMRKIDRIVRLNTLPIVFEHTVKWDMLHLLVEAEYSEIVPPSFFAGIAYWYIQGHFPCGWEGEYSNGKQIIY